MAAEADGERLTHDETVTMIANLLVAGHDTAGSQIPCSMLMALQHCGDLNGIHEYPVRLASAVAEIMRLEPSVPLIPRTAIAPIELHGATIAAGTMVFLCIAAACLVTRTRPRDAPLCGRMRDRTGVAPHHRPASAFQITGALR